MRAKKLNIPQEVADKLGVNIDVVNRKLQAIVDSKKDKSLEEVLNEYAMVEDYDIFTKKELIALLMDAGAEAGFYQFKLDLLIKSGAVDMDKFREVMSRKVTDDIDDIEEDLGFRKDFL